jgi:hypothetical protein
MTLHDPEFGLDDAWHVEKAESLDGACAALLVACLLLLATSPSAGWPQDKKDPDTAKGNPGMSAQKADEFEGNLESLTKQRREQKKRDPITIEVEIPKDLHATTRELPVFNVALKNVDEEKAPVRM